MLWRLKTPQELNLALWQVCHVRQISQGLVPNWHDLTFLSGFWIESMERTQKKQWLWRLRAGRMDQNSSDLWTHLLSVCSLGEIFFWPDFHANLPDLRIPSNRQIGQPTYCLANPTSKQTQSMNLRPGFDAVDIQLLPLLKKWRADKVSGVEPSKSQHGGDKIREKPR